MKRWIIFQCLIIIASAIVGQLGKLTFKNCGVNDLKKIDNLNTLGDNIELDFIWRESDLDNLSKYEKGYISQNNPNIVVIAEPTGNIYQRNICFGQEVIIKKVIKGDNNILNTSAYIYGDGVDGFCLDNKNSDTIKYFSSLNVMKADHKYLIFMNPLEINKYLPHKGYRLSNPFFGYLDLTSNKSTILPKSNKLYFEFLKNTEFISGSEDVLKLLLDIKRQIISQYLGNNKTTQLN